MANLTTKFLLFAALCAKLITAEANEVEAVQLSSPGCTSTLVLTQSRLPTPPYWPQCSWDGTLTLYPSTVTINRSVDCDGCAAVQVTEVPRVHCPAEIVSTSVYATTPLTLYRTVCSATPTAGK